MEITTVQASRRKAYGTKVAKSIRAAGQLPVIVYGHGEPPESISILRHDVEVALAHGARTLEVELDGEKKSFLIKEVQYDHLGTTPIHMDLARVDLTERVQIRVGIELKGTPKGISEGGVLEQPMADIEVECLVSAIPDTLRPIVTHLGVGDTLLVKDLDLPPGVVALANPEDRIAAVRMLAVEAEAPAAPVEAETAPAEPERIGRVRKEEEEGAE